MSKYKWQVEKEFEKPFADVVLGYLNMGYNVESTAIILGIPRREMYRLIKRHGIKKVWVKSK